MNDDAPVIYGLEFQARSLCAQQGETEAIRFLVGTQSLKSPNQVHLVDFDEENNVLNKYVFLHAPGEVWHINASPCDKNILGTCYSVLSDGRTSMKASLWRIPPLDELEPPSMFELGGNTAHQNSLQHITELQSEHGDMKNIIWNPSSDDGSLLTVSDRYLDLWDCNGNNAQLKDSIPLAGKEQLRYGVARFNPHHGGSTIAAGIESGVKGYDLRSLATTFSIDNAHSQMIRDLDFNPNKQYYFATCSDDCRVKFWDTRNTSECLMTRSDHSHWVWSVRYNNFHDQLILTSSSDSRVILSNIASLSSEPFGHVDEDEDVSNHDPVSDRVISHFDEHEDSIYSVEWSSADPWIFASVSYDGRLVVNRVPRAEKYKILL